MSSLKFSSLVRFVFTGGFALAIAYLLYSCNSNMAGISEAITGNAVLESLKSIGGIGITVAIAVMYFVGVLFFGLRMSLSRNCKISKFAGWRKFLFPYIRLDVNHLCNELKESREEGRRIPDWIYMVKRPGELLDRVVEYMFKGAREDADDEMRYMNDTATTLIFILYLAIPTQLVISTVNLVQYLIEGNLAIELTHILISLTAVLAVLVMLILILSVTAKTFAVKFLMKLGHMENVCKGIEGKSDMPFSPNEYPTAFILIRTTKKGNKDKDNKKDKSKDKGYRYLENALRSVTRQDYPNIRVIILDDVESADKSGTKDPEITTIINAIQDRPDQRQGKAEKKWEELISYNREVCEGPAGSAFRIRELFLMVAKERDIAIMLDDDDTLRHDGAISDIVLHMCMNQADICLCSFETIENMHLNICNNGGKTHNDIVKRLEEEARVFDNSMVMASSIGWTKAYTYRQVRKYNKCILGTGLQIRINDKGETATRQASSIYEQLQRYEDFPDILVLASSEKEEGLPKITGVSIPTHNYSKHRGGITTTPNIKDFKHARPKFLALALKLAFAEKKKDWTVSSENVLDIVKYVLFKTLQICNILMKLRREYEKGNKKLEEFRDETKDSFIGYLRTALDEILIDGEKDKLKEKLAIIAGVRPETDKSSADLMELLKDALEKFYKENSKDIDIKNLEWYIKEHPYAATE